MSTAAKLKAAPEPKTLSTIAPAALLERYQISEDDLRLVHSYGEIITPKLAEFVQLFYDWLEKQPEYPQFFSDPQTVEHVKELQLRYWQTFFRAEVNEAYVRERVVIGETHARIGLSLSAYFASMNHALKLLLSDLYDDSLKQEDYIATSSAVTRLTHLDTAVVVGKYSDFINARVSAQSKALLDMSTPVTQIWSDILMLPLVGIIDSKRAQDVMNVTLNKISETQSRKFILDISGVAVVDTAVANHLIKITKATRMMGCDCTISGLSPAIAQTIVELGIDVGKIRTTANMRDALVEAFKALDIEIKETKSQ